MHSSLKCLQIFSLIWEGLKSTSYLSKTEDIKLLFTLQAVDSWFPCPHVAYFRY